MASLKLSGEATSNELDRQGASKGTVSRLLRHSDTLAEARYIQPSIESEVKAIQALPDLWPENRANRLEEMSARADTTRARTSRAMQTHTDNLTLGSAPSHEHGAVLANTPGQSPGSSCLVEAPVSGETRVGPQGGFPGVNGQSKAIESFSGSNLDRLLLVAEANARNLARILDLMGGSSGKRAD